MTEAVTGTHFPVTTLARRELWRFALFMCALNLAVPLGLIVYARLTGADYWTLFWDEDSLITWFSSIQLLLVGLVAWLNNGLAGVARSLEAGSSGHSHWIWLIFTAGFIFLALDERFEIHEALRDDVLKPASAIPDLRYLNPGDIVLYLYFLIGVVCAWYLFQELRRYPRSLVFFGAALLIALSSIVIDGLPNAVLRSWPLYHFWHSVFEEVSEIWAQLLFLLAFVTVLRGRLQTLAAGSAGTATE